MKSLRVLLIRHPLVAFFSLAYGISWLFWLPAILPNLRESKHLGDATPFLFLGGFGPFLAALVLAAAADGSPGIKALMNRLVRWRVALRWYLVALYGFPVVGLWTVLFFGAASLRQVFAELPYAFVTLSFNTLTSFLVLGPLGEEPGWRGFALPRLLMDHSPLRASLILGFVWAYWHAPLMLVPEWRSGLSIGLFVVLYPLNVVALTIIFTWISRQTTGSVLISMLLHSAYNATVYYLDNAFDLGRYDPLMVLGGTAFVLWLTVLALIAVFGPRLDGRRHTP